MVLLLNRQRLQEALELAGSYLEDLGCAIEVVGIGGSALLLLGVIERPTQDLDLIDLGVDDADSQLSPGL